MWGKWERCALAVALVLGCVTAVTGSGTALENGLQSVRDAVRSHSASGQIHIVEVDARSIAAIKHWPWPRGEHARLVDALRVVGANTIAFDVDFSAPSDAIEDERFAAALRRARGAVILPTFRQSEGSGASDQIESLPIASLRNAAFLGAVNIVPDADGFVRRAPFGTITAGAPRPSLAALLGRHNGTAFDDFPIDFAIEPASVPRHSFIDVVRDPAKATALAGKDVIIGATAIELGDRYAVPRHGVIPGVVIQAIAAETLRRGTPVHWSPILAIALAIVIGWAAGMMKTTARLLAVAVAGGSLLMLAAGLAQALLSASLPIVPALVTLVTAALFGIIRQRMLAHHHRARIDAATGMPNRAALDDRVRTVPRAQVVAAVIARFDDIAASLGPAATAQMVQRVAERLALVATDRMVFRLDDRLLAWDATHLDPEALIDSLRGLRAVFRSPVEVGGRRIDVALSFGIASGDGATAGIATAAAAAASHALESGDRWQFADNVRTDAAERDLSLMNELDDALSTNSVDVVFQPKLQIASGAVVSAEALVRWTHPKRGPISPEVFVGLAEQTDRIDGLTLYVLRGVIAALKATAAAGAPITIAVNISAKLLSSPSFDAEVVRLLEPHRGILDRLIFEVTESAAVADIVAARATLTRYRKLGIAISMDDYGTGLSTLTYLKQLPLSELKIDRSFVTDAHRNGSDAILVQSTIELAHRLGLKIVAEGVEDQECLDFLARAGCDYAQGWLVSKPLPLPLLIDYIKPALKSAA